MSLASIDSALEDIRSGVPVIVVDDEERENAVSYTHLTLPTKA